MEYNYENKEKMNKLKNDPKVKKERKKKWLYYCLACTPIFLGMLLYVTFCSATKNYSRIYNNTVIEELTTDNYIYQIGDENKVMFSYLENNNNEYKISSKEDGKLFYIDLEQVRSLNDKYSDVMFDFYFDASANKSECQTRTKFPTVKLSFDGKEASKLVINNDSYAAFKWKSVNANSGKILSLDISDYGTTTGCEDYNGMLFKNLRLKVFGVN